MNQLQHFRHEYRVHLWRDRLIVSGLVVGALLILAAGLMR
jgi:hypothetical protein